ncbi:hypothetical protein PRZ48_014605 [Zasmidium cellare]|uniref:Uncharacterized protein n=1 Tax=Zasmidium cellare TaxID=395010 RepID=A0ABR0DYQ7_ZASCE|nr:hypothetical protein PRZ48_014605 [Zasmidium cellare]
MAADDTDDTDDTNDTIELRTHLESLPQELYDHIYDLTFTANPCVHYLDRFYPRSVASFAKISKLSKVARPLFQKPDSPNLLHVDRASRRKFAQSFYGGHGSVFVADHLVCGFVDRIGRFIRSLPEEHQEMVRDIRAVVPASPFFFTEAENSQWMADEIEYEGGRLQRIFGTRVRQVTMLGAEDMVTADLDGYYSRRSPTS